MNLCDFPFATISERAGDRNFMRFELDDPQGEHQVKRFVTVKGDVEYGLPTAKDEEIYLGLLKHTSDTNSFVNRQVTFSRGQLFHLMGWPKNKWAYDRLTLGLHRLSGVRLSYKQLWRDNDNKQWRDQGAFGILDSFRLRDQRLARHFREYESGFSWSDVLFQSFQSNYLKQIDYGLVRSVGVTARRLYRYLDKHFHPPKRVRIEIDLARLGYQHLGISPNVSVDKVRSRYLGPAVEELSAAGYLDVGSAFRKQCRGVWNCDFRLARRRSKPVAQKTDPLITELRRLGCSERTVRQLMANHSPVQLQQAVQSMNEQIRRGVEIRSADAWLQSAVTRQYEPTTSQGAAASKRPEHRVFSNGKFIDRRS